ncbi:hypothetical protein Rsub_04156 [Raphidocelis subcapitata]|uniref:Uncharacterized protein n=1 Tax=Raphidocelis subcapitata TaxID=307507 RepID=A0A2V0NUV8_9CHLO|nr:hypothetical protein Rsub_04156 [Raphidocelis subcapitata]|eukprot:GBF91416.1 hypothetical protein Rsub_04156 [Raphidocelis subcapitata]
MVTGAGRPCKERLRMRRHAELIAEPISRRRGGKKRPAGLEARGRSRGLADEKAQCQGEERVGGGGGGGGGSRQRIRAGAGFERVAAGVEKGEARVRSPAARRLHVDSRPVPLTAANARTLLGQAHRPWPLR